MRLRDALNKRQKSYAVVERIGDILLDAVPHFSPFVSYGSHQLYGKFEFEKEKSANPAFQKFVDVSSDSHILILVKTPREIFVFTLFHFVNLFSLIRY